MNHPTEQKVAAYIKERQLFPPGTPLLVACSGGVDSMVLAEVLHRLGYPIGLAHCNFRLRMPDSDADEAFVRNYAAGLGLPFHTIGFDTETYAREQKLSIQEAARDLRYGWLEEVRRLQGFHFVATGHHKNDNAETVVMNLARNAGLRGLHGIPPKRDGIVRPLLGLDRGEIAAYARERGVAYREDVTNASVKYSRNYVRRHIIPELENINPAAVQAIAELADRVCEAEILVAERVEQVKRKVVVQRFDSVEVRTGLLLVHGAGPTLLYELLRDYGFSGHQAQAIHRGIGAQPGGEYLSATHRLLTDRKSLFITPLETDRTWIRRWDKLPDQLLFNGYKVQVRTVPAGKVTLRKSAGYAYFDYDRIVLPLTMRYWKPGDYFYPFGLTKQRSGKPGKKKLSKYFKDEKVPVAVKETTPVLFSGEHLIWLVGHRTDHRFRVTENTKTVLKMKLLRP